MRYVFFSSRRRHTRLQGDWSSDVCSSDLRKPRRSPWQVRMPFAWAASIAVALGIGYFFGNPEQRAPSVAAAPPAAPVAMMQYSDSAAPAQEEKASAVRQRQSLAPR